MGKRILITATELHTLQFWTYHIKRLIDDGNDVELVCSNVGGKLEQLKQSLEDIGNPRLTVVDLKRNPLNPHNLIGYFQLRKYFKNNSYDVVITNEPVMGVMTRLAARTVRKEGTRVIYFAHGFHFWQGAPKLNWMIFYPIEKFAAHFTDTIVTMNSEDYKLAKDRLKAKSIEYTYGIGADLNRFYKDDDLRHRKRQELGIRDEIVIFTVSELSKRKNLRLALDIIKCLKDDGYNVRYFVRGVGPYEKEYKQYAEAIGINDIVNFMGYGKDIYELDNAADVFLFTSLQEGLPVSVMEAMSCCTPCVVSDIRGVNDLVENGNAGYVCQLDDVQSFVQNVEKIIDDADLRKRLTENNYSKLEPYKIENVYEFISGLVDQND